MEQPIVEYSITDAAIAKMESLYLCLTVKNVEDKEGFEQVHDGRMVVKRKRLDVEAKRKELKADSLAWGKKVDAEAKRITLLLKPIEAHLQAQEAIVTEEKERIKAEQEAAEKAKIEDRVTALFAVNVNVPYFEIAMLSDAEYESMLDEATNNHMAERLRIQEEQKAKEKEEARLDVERANQEAEAKQLAKQKARQEAAAELIRIEQEAKAQAIADKEAAIDAKRKTFEDEKRVEAERIEREAFEKQAAEDARIQARKDAEKERTEYIAKVEETRLRSLQAVGFVYLAKDLGTMQDKKFFALHNKYKKIWDEKQKEILVEKIEQERVKKEKAEEAEKARVEAAMSDKEKLKKWVNLFDYIDVPDLQTPEAHEIHNEATNGLGVILQETLEKIEEM